MLSTKGLKIQVSIDNSNPDKRAKRRLARSHPEQANRFLKRKHQHNQVVNK